MNKGLQIIVFRCSPRHRHGLDTTLKCCKRKERGRQSDRNAAGIPRNPPPLPLLSSITVHKSIRSFNVQHNGQGQLFCDHNARKHYLSAKNVRTIGGPWLREQSVRKLRQVPTSCENILLRQAEGRAGRVAVNSTSRAEEQLNHKKKKKV